MNDHICLYCAKEGKETPVPLFQAQLTMGKTGWAFCSKHYGEALGRLAARRKMHNARRQQSAERIQ